MTPEITAHEQMLKEKRERDELFRLAIEAIPNVVLVVDQGGKIILVNSQVEQLFGYTGEELFKQPIEMLIPKRFRHNHVHYRTEFLHKPETRMMGRGRNLYAIRKDGSEFPVEVGLNSLTTSNGSIFVLAAIVDITVRKKAEEAEKQVAMEQAANKAKSEFLANLSHEIRTPISSIIGTIELLNDTKLDTEQKEYTHAIHSSGEILLSLINDILDFSKIEAKELTLCNEPFNLSILTDEIVSTFGALAKQHNDTLSFEYQPAAPAIVIGDQKRLRQILFNLISNAIKFTRNGQIIIRIQVISAKEPEITLRFEVKDNGIGIAPEKQDSIFEKFKQAESSTYKKFGGTGLGLAISKELVALMRGVIGVESIVGKGSCFWFEIPFTVPTELHLAHIASQDSTALQAPHSTKPQFQGRILLVEDYYPNQQLAKKMLEKMGLAVDVASDGEYALEKLKANSYDLVFMDCQMPEMDGFEATRLIRKDTAIQNSIIIAMTADAMKGDKEKCIAAGMDDYISKPLRYKDLEDILAKHLPGNKTKKIRSNML